ncbi:DMT family transporter [Helicobacter sp. MIT 05-5293]|nr:DMT family transporter [Helicobacter sp. MIT 05-5293]
MYSPLSIGILAMLVSSFFFAVMGAEGKILSNHLSPIEIAFFRAFVMLLFLLPMVIGKPIKHAYQRKGGWWILTARAVAGGLSFVALFYNISTIALGTATAFAQSMPLYIVVLSIIFLKERIKWGVIAFTIIGFVGILLICDPRLDTLGAFNIFLGIVSGLGMAIAFLNLQALKDYFTSSFIIFFTGVVMCLVACIVSFVPFSPMSQAWVMPRGIEWLHLVLLGFFGTIGQYFLTKAYMNAPAGIISPIDYTRLVFSWILGLMLGDALPSLETALGIVLIIISGIGVGLPVFLHDMRNYRQRRKNG